MNHVDTLSIGNTQFIIGVHFLPLIYIYICIMYTWHPEIPREFYIYCTVHKRFIPRRIQYKKLKEISESWGSVGHEPHNFLVSTTRYDFIRCSCSHEQHYFILPNLLNLVFHNFVRSAQVKKSEAHKALSFFYGGFIN